jgi:hypothetical protein
MYSVENPILISQTLKTQNPWTIKH